ncbi:MAG: hypothetical protein OXC44_00660 [Proteobacteria bacterium]|nr:hypothetical protein [Pseudomonadota bacterium]
MNALSLFSRRFIKSPLTTLVVWMFALSSISSAAYGHSLYNSGFVHTHEKAVTASQLVEAVTEAVELKINYLEAEAVAFQAIIDALKNINVEDENTVNMAKERLDAAISDVEELKRNYVRDEEEVLKRLLDKLSKFVKKTEGT